MPNNRQKFADLDHGASVSGASGDQADPSGEGQGDTGGEPGGESGGDGGDGGEPKPKYTDADVDEIVKKRLMREQAKMEREIRKSVEDEAASKQTEAQKLESMTALQRAQYEAKKLKEEKEALERERDLSNQMAIARREMAAADINLDDELLAMFVSPDAEKTSAAIDRIKELMPKAVNEAVRKRLSREVPPGEQGDGGKSYGAKFAERYTQGKVKSKDGGGR